MKKLVIVLGVVLTSVMSQAQLNSSFESGIGLSADNWTKWGNAYRETWAAYTGGRGMAFHGWEGTGGFYQDLAASAGLTYSLTAYYNDDIIPTTALFRTKIEWLDSSSANVGTSTLNLTTLNNTWQQIGFSDIAPAGTVTARLVFEVYSTANSGQTLKIDDVSFTVVPEPSSLALLGLGLGGLMLRRKK